ncbi:MAG TPA: hypothetical protein PKL92_04845 [Aquaticitalea sp.]|nr:hypothetical protein [Aquaticitalea sp.]HNU59992.1 hypothetical protein [Aquaticitalea sp.]
MGFSRIVNIILIVTGGVVAVYAQAGANQNQYFLIAGICALMLGVYGISRNIPGKSDNDDTDERV